MGVIFNLKMKNLRNNFERNSKRVDLAFIPLMKMKIK